MSFHIITRISLLLLCLSSELFSVTIDEVTAKKQKVVTLIKKSNYRMHPAINMAYLNYKRTEAMFELQKRKTQIPAAFINWINKTPTVKTAVYGTRKNVADVIETLWALRLGLGGKRFQQNIQLMLAGALFNSNLKSKANNLKAMVRLKPSSLLLKDPRKPVNTRSRKRKLDANDHIINFLNSHKIKSDHNANDNQLFTELKYDTRGVAISNKSTGKRRDSSIRNLYASDVMADPALQQQFNQYMKSKGFPKVQVNCGDHLVYWKSTNMVGTERGGIRKAYELFKTAYEEKGLLPKSRPLPTLSEWFAFLIRNNQVKKVSKGSWPLFPLNAPWPVLRLLTYNYKMQTLRECEERWVAFRNKREMRCYGEYIGKVAQQWDMQSARRLAPYPFTYGSIQIIMKDGGVCGLMARMGTLTQLTLGIPAVQAGQPGHCALIVYNYNYKEGTYKCSLQQGVTAGPSGTWPKASYNFADCNSHLGMVYEQVTAYAVNYSLPKFTSSLTAYNAFSTLPTEDQKKFAKKYLMTVMKINPYNLIVMDRAISLTNQPKELVRMGMEFLQLFTDIKEKGCPKEGLYQKTVRDKIIEQIGKLELPKQKKIIYYVYNFLNSAPCDDLVLMKYRLKVETPQSILKKVVMEFKAYIKGVWALPLKESDKKTEMLNSSLMAYQKAIPSKENKKKWSIQLLKIMSGKEMFFNLNNDLIVNPIFTDLIKSSGRTKPSEEQMLHSVQLQLYNELKYCCKKCRKFTIDDFKVYAQNIKGVVQTFGENDQTRKWLKALATLLENHKTVTVSSGVVLDNPCYLTVKKLSKRKQKK